MLASISYENTDFQEEVSHNKRVITPLSSRFEKKLHNRAFLHGKDDHI